MVMTPGVPLHNVRAFPARACDSVPLTLGLAYKNLASSFGKKTQRHRSASRNQVVPSQPRPTAHEHQTTPYPTPCRVAHAEKDTEGGSGGKYPYNMGMDALEIKAWILVPCPASVR